MRSQFGFPRFGLRGALPPKLSLCDSSQLSPLRLAVCLVVSGHFSTQTCSNRLTRLHVWWSLLLWSLVLLPCLCCHPQQARPAPGPVAARECPFREALWKVFCSLRAHSELLLSLHCDSCSWMIGTFLCSVTLQRDVSPCSLTYCYMYPILGHILRVRIQRHLRNPLC